jgi:radical SAM superfamily enzyme YgiQ (UPF0313 family)
MKILLVYPEYTDTFWSFKHTLKFISKKAAFPPLGLLTVAALLPAKWEKKLIDLNTQKLKQSDILWADYIFISAIGTQYNSTVETIERCKSLGKKVVAGGPLFTEDFEKFETVDHLILNEAEITLPMFISDLEKNTAKRVYKTDQFADITNSPTPDFSLINLAIYSSKSIQYSRGCPYNCEFCDITALLGHKPRIKSTQQVLNELQNIYDLGGRGNLFFVDDNFIGNKHRLKTDLLPAIIEWMQAHNHPFNLSTEASINLADNPELMKLMTQADFSTVFIGIETPQETSLEECNKVQNKNRNLIDSVKKVQQAGIEVQGGFIVGFDNDLPTIFKQQIEFIQESGIISAMIGLLNAPTKSKLYKRLKGEGRILNKMSGDNTDASTNIIPKMNIADLKSGYQEVIRGIYSGKAYYDRIHHFLKDFDPLVKNKTKMTFNKFMALIKSIFIIGIFDNNRKYYWKLFFWSLFKHPKIFPLAITYSIYGYHFTRVFKKIY